MNEKQKPDINIHKIGNIANPATEGDIKKLIHDIKQPWISDTAMLDWLQLQTRGYGLGWICRDSFTGRGMRLHETNLPDAKGTVREAILAAMKHRAQK